MSKQDLNIDFKNQNQVISMGGPWVGDLFIKGTLVSDKVVLDNIVFNKSSDHVFFVKYHEISNWQNENFFTINSLNLITDEIHESKERFQALFISDSKSKHELKVYKSFHDGFEEMASSMKLSEIFK